jgi:hypothetical protein
MAYCNYGLTKIVGLALNSFKKLSRSTDALILDGVSFHDDLELASRADKAFRTGMKVALNEF